MILSIDVGIRNLAMCLLDENHDNLVREWMSQGFHPNTKMVSTSHFENTSTRDLGYSRLRRFSLRNNQNEIRK